VRKKLYAKEPIPIVEELIAEYEIAIAQNLRLEAALHELLKKDYSESPRSSARENPGSCLRMYSISAVLTSPVRDRLCALANSSSFSSSPFSSRKFVIAFIPLI